mgnify:FL=1
MKNKNEEFEDDGHTIVDMSQVERPNLFSFRRNDTANHEVKSKRSSDNYSYSYEERRWAIFGALKASMLIGLAYIVVLGLVVLLLVLYFNKG